MNVYVIQSSKKIEPFGDHHGDCLITNKRLSELQREALAELGLVPTAVGRNAVDDSKEHVVLGDNLFFTKEAMGEFISKSRRRNQPTIAALKPGVATSRSVVNTQDVNILPDRVEYNLRYVPESTKRSAEPFPILFDIDRTERIPMPKHMTGQGEGYHVPMTPMLLIQIDHWTNLWAANIASLLANAARLLTASKLVQLGLAARARSLNPWNVMRQTNRIGKNCDIHPTAYVEGSTIGDNVTIEAKTTVRQATVGNNTYLGDNCTVHVSVLGEGCNLQAGSLVEFTVLYPGVCSNDRVIAISMCGRDCFIGGNVIFTNFRLDKKNIMVMKDGELIDSGNTFMGSCVGHGVYLGAGCVIAPGRTIPNGTRIAPEETHVIRKCVNGEEVPGYRRVRPAN